MGHKIIFSNVLYRLTCLFLSTKSESERISIDQFGKNLNLPSTDSILGLEFVVSQGIRFEYLVHHPYRAAYGLFLELQVNLVFVYWDMRHLNMEAIERRCGYQGAQGDLQQGSRRDWINTLDRFTLYLSTITTCFGSLCYCRTL